MRTKFLSFALAILMSMAASVASAFEVDGIYYIITSSSSPYTVEVICRGDGPISYYTGSVTIPESVTYNGITYSVTSIGERAFEYCDGLTSVTIGNSVTSIGESAFCGCDNLTSVTIGSSVTSIGFSAFDYCWSLPSITIPNSVTNIGSYAFIECRSLTSITIPNSVTCIGSSAFEGTAWYDNQPDGLVYAGKVAYTYKGTMPEETNIVLEEGTVGIADYAFSECESLTSITIPNSVTRIGDNAFDGCYGLTSVSIGNSVTSIGDYAFDNCSGLTSITIPNSVTNIGWSTFCECTGLTSITIPNNVTSIGQYAFSGTAWYNNQPDGLVYAGKVAYTYKGTMPEGTNIVLEEGTLGIADGAFFDCSGLTSITIPNSVTNIGNGAFWFCSGLTSIAIPNSVTNIGNGAFWGCSGLTSVTLPNSVTSIGEGVFGICRDLTSVTIPNSVTSIGYEAFRDCASLTSVTIPNSVISIGGGAFYGCSGLTSITISNSVTNIGWSTFCECTNLTRINCRATTPPDCDESFIEDVPLDCTIEVPVGCKAAYEAVSPWNNFTIVETEDPVETTTVTLAAEYGTFCSAKALDFTNVEGVKAYIASAFDAETGQLTLTRVYNVKAGTGLILRGTKGETYEIPVGTGATTVSNLLVGVTEDTELEPIDGEFTNFILAKDAVKGIGFYRVASRSTLKAGKAYLQLPSDELSSEVKGFRMLFDDGDMSDNVETMHNSQCIMHNGAGAVYDLQGRRVAKPTKGIYIVNGKKTVIK